MTFGWGKKEKGKSNGGNKGNKGKWNRQKEKEYNDVKNRGLTHGNISAWQVEGGSLATISFGQVANVHFVRKVTEQNLSMFIVRALTKY